MGSRGRALTRPARLVAVLATAIGLHSCLLGLLLLSAPRFVLELAGFPPETSMFFPTQSGIFLLIMGALYLAARKRPAFEATIVLSKSAAVGFLSVHLLLGTVPPVILPTAIGDGLMLVSFSAALLWRRRQVEATRRSAPEP